MHNALRLLFAALLLLLVLAAACQQQAIANCCPVRASNHDPSPEIPMSSSTLTPGNFPAGPDRRIHQGHGTAALGPSDSSDSGSDMQGAADVMQAGLDGADLDADSDRNGTGERAAADAEGEPRDGSDIDTDHVETIPEDNEDDEDA